MDDAAAIWAAKTDDELLDASGELFEYTEAGEQIIRAELQRRGLAAPDPPIGRCARCGRSIAANHPGDRCAECGEPFPWQVMRMRRPPDPQAELVAVLRTNDPGLIPLAKSTLDEAGVEYLVKGEGLQDPFASRHDAVEFWVSDDDVPRARTLLEGFSAPPADPGADSTAPPNAERSRSLREHLIGHWDLVSFAALNGSDVEYPWGYDIAGVIVYDAAGHMATQIMRHDRPRFASGDMDNGSFAELSAALSGYTAYFGTYSVDDSAGAVIHQIKGSL